VNQYIAGLLLPTLTLKTYFHYIINEIKMYLFLVFNY